MIQANLWSSHPLLKGAASNFESDKIVESGLSITDALNSLNTYDIWLIKDLKQDRYLVGLKKNPGIERLKNDFIGSEYIKHIQPNFTYTTQ